MALIPGILFITPPPSGSMATAEDYFAITGSGSLFDRMG